MMKAAHREGRSVRHACATGRGDLLRVLDRRPKQPRQPVFGLVVDFSKLVAKRLKQSRNVRVVGAGEPLQPTTGVLRKPRLELPPLLRPGHGPWHSEEVGGSMVLPAALK